MKRKYFIYWFVYCMGLVNYTSYLRHNTAYLWNIASIFTVILAKIACSRLSVITIAPMNIASVFNNQSQFCLSVFSVCFCYQRCRCSTFIYGLFWNHNALIMQHFRTNASLKAIPGSKSYINTVFTHYHIKIFHLLGIYQTKLLIPFTIRFRFLNDLTKHLVNFKKKDIAGWSKSKARCRWYGLELWAEILFLESV